MRQINGHPNGGANRTLKPENPEILWGTGEVRALKLTPLRPIGRRIERPARGRDRPDDDARGWHVRLTSLYINMLPRNKQLVPYSVPHTIVGTSVTIGLALEAIMRQIAVNGRHEPRASA